MRRKKVNDGALNREYFRVAAAAVEELFLYCCNSHIEVRASTSLRKFALNKNHYSNPPSYTRDTLPPRFFQ